MPCISFKCENIDRASNVLEATIWALNVTRLISRPNSCYLFTCLFVHQAITHTSPFLLQSIAIKQAWMNHWHIITWDFVYLCKMDLCGWFITLMHADVVIFASTFRAKHGFVCRVNFRLVYIRIIMWSARNVKSDRQERSTRAHYYYDFDLSRGMHRGDYWWWRQGISPASSSIHIENNEPSVISLAKLCWEMQVYCSCKRRGKQSDWNYWHGPSRGFFIPSIHQSLTDIMNVGRKEVRKY